MAVFKYYFYLVSKYKFIIVTEIGRYLMKDNDFIKTSAFLIFHLLNKQHRIYSISVIKINCQFSCTKS